MFLLARVVGVFAYTTILVLICMQINKTYNACKYLSIYVIILAIMGYLFIPPDGFDINRLIERMHYYGDLSIVALFKSMMIARTPGEQLYYWIVRKFNNDNMLKALSGFISFYFCFNILKRESRQKSGDIHLDSFICSVVLYLFMSRGLLIMAVSNIRSMMSSSLIAYCVYREYIEGREPWKNAILYIWAISMHALGLGLVLIRFMFLFIDKTDTARKKINRLILMMILVAAGLILFKNYIILFFDKLRNYAGAKDGYSYIWEGILSGISIWLTFYLAILYKRCNFDLIDIGSGCFNIVKFSVVIAVIATIFAFIEFNTFMRLGCFLAIIQMPILFRLLCNLYYKSTINYYIVRNNINIIATVMLVISCTRGYLCSLKFFV